MTQEKYRIMQRSDCHGDKEYGIQKFGKRWWKFWKEPDWYYIEAFGCATHGWVWSSSYKEVEAVLKMFQSWENGYEYKVLDDN